MTETHIPTNTHTFIPRPGRIGRILRFAVGAYQIYFVVSVLPHAQRLIGGPLPGNVGYWLAVAIAFWLLPPVIDIGFNLSWGKNSQIALLGLGLVAAIGDLFLFGQIWAPLLSTLVFALGIYVHTHLGFSHILSALLATPGCEMRALPHLVTLFRSGDPQTQACPGMWDRLDRWETGSAIESPGGTTS